eukprot:6470729-Amphidinium_carterae.1
MTKTFVWSVFLFWSRNLKRETPKAGASNARPCPLMTPASEFLSGCSTLRRYIEVWYGAMLSGKQFSQNAKWTRVLTNVETIVSE